jgi:hypothetical protein
MVQKGRACDRQLTVTEPAMKAILHILGIGVFLTGCASIPSYEGPKGSSPPAFVSNFGSTLCGPFSAFRTNRICGARVFTVDGQSASMWASAIEMDPGLHTFRFVCIASPEPGGFETPNIYTYHTVRLVSGGKYRIEAVWDVYCRMKLIDESNGNILSQDP